MALRRWGYGRFPSPLRSPRRFINMLRKNSQKVWLTHMPIYRAWRDAKDDGVDERQDIMQAARRIVDIIADAHAQIEREINIMDARYPKDRYK